MKKSYLVLFLTILFSVSMFSQENPDKKVSENFNEIKINGLYLVLGAFDITYERTESLTFTSLKQQIDRQTHL